MKLSSRLAMFKRQKQRTQTAPGPTHPPGGRSALRRRALVALCLLLAAGGTLATLDLFLWNKLPAEFVGKWQVTEGPMAGGTFEFFRNGTMEVHGDKEGTDVNVTARVTVEDRTLRTTSQDPVSRQEETHSSHHPGANRLIRSSSS